MKILFFDTETSGMYQMKLPYQHPSQPHLMQLGAIVEDTTDEPDVPYREFETLVHVPPEARIEEGALAAHGITPLMCANHGLPLADALDALLEFAGEVECIICHNLDFDVSVLLSAFYRAGKTYPFYGRRTFCTMKYSTKICKIPGPYGYKWPKLIEAYRLLINPDGFEGAHNALADVRATREVYHALVRLKMQQMKEAGEPATTSNQ